MVYNNSVNRATIQGPPDSLYKRQELLMLTDPTKDNYESKTLNTDV